MDKKLKIVDLDGTDAPLELLALDIEKLAKAGESLLKSRLTNRALHLLLQDACQREGKKISLADIDSVLKGIPELRGALKSKQSKVK